MRSLAPGLGFQIPLARCRRDPGYERSGHLAACGEELGSSRARGFGTGDALIVVDVQRDFLPGGSLAVPQGDAVVPVLNGYLDLFQAHGLPIFATRDWHPSNHCSFRVRGGPWPAHCVAGSYGAEFALGLKLPPSVTVISKATDAKQDAYSGFQNTELDQKLAAAGIHRLFVGGLATDHCVLNTVKDALALGYRVLLLEDAVRAVNVRPEDGGNAVAEMVHLGAKPIRAEALVQ
jgi:nicotinamidase/pyrazinamidase